ncbi:erg26, C-3 sterol dehydrogenase [Agyrium rufum]|nr:erg26, C-3 sterol dehydrogenase [Agyrium rufum]
MTAEALYGTVLVIGGSGFLDRHITDALVKSQAFSAVAVLDTRIHSRIPNVAYFQGDTTAPVPLRLLIGKTQPQTIIHAASPLAHNEYPDPALHKRVTVKGTASLLACSKQEASVLAFVYTSSGTVIDGVEYVLADETFPVLSGVLDQKFYSQTKATADTMVLEANDPVGGLDGSGRLRTLCDNSKYTDYTYVSNVADAHVLAAKALFDGAISSNPHGPKVDGEAFFITNDEPWLYWDFIRKVWACAGYETPLNKVWVIPNSVALGICSIAEWYIWITSCGRRRPKKLVRHQIENGCCMTRTLCIDKAKERLGYRPRIGLEEGIKKGVEWALSREITLAGTSTGVVHKDKDI